jgi:hypothetical protein
MSNESTSLRFLHSGISLAESETIYSILNKNFQVIEDDREYQFDDQRLQGIIKIHFPFPFCEPFFELFADGWFSMKNVLKDMRKRRGRRGLVVQLSFDGFIQNEEIIHKDIILQLNHTLPKEFEMAIEKIDYLVDAIATELAKTQEKTSPFVYVYNTTRKKWLLRTYREPNMNRNES